MKKSEEGCIIRVCSSSIALQQLLKKANEINKGENIVQLFDKEHVINKIHLLGAYVDTMEAFRNKTNIAKSPALELLLYVAMTRQISDAIKTVGAKSNKSFVLFCNNKEAYMMVKRLVKNEKEFDPKKSDSVKIAKKFGITQANDLNQFILQKMALSRIED